MNKKIIKLCAIVTILSLIGLMIPWQGVEAGQLTEARDYLGTMRQNLSSGESHEIYFKPATGLSGTSNKVILVFPSADNGKWCATEGSDLTVSTSGLRETGATPLPEGTSLSASCTQGSGSSGDTITISGVGALTAGTLYGFKVSDSSGSTAKLGTPAAGSDKIITIKTNDGSSDVDSRDIAVAILTNDQIGVSATVNPSLSFSISETSLDLGILTSSSVSEAGPSTLTVSTNASNGVVIDIKDENSGLSNGSHTIPATGSGGITAGTEGYGVYGDNASGLTVDEGFDNDSSDVPISTSYQTFATASGPVNSAHVNLNVKAAISGSTPPGSYSDTITVIATGKF